MKELKALKALEDLIDTMPFALAETNSMKYVQIIEKELKALEIIRNKSVKISQIKTCLDLYSYNSCLNMYDKPLTQEEYNLLKEVLC